MNLDRSPDLVGSDGKQRPLVIAGWSYGFNKVEFIKMLQNELGYSLSIAKGITDQVLTRKPVELLLFEADYERILLLSGQLGAIVGQEVIRDGRGNICL